VETQLTFIEILDEEIPERSVGDRRQQLNFVRTTRALVRDTAFFTQFERRQRIFLWTAATVANEVGGVAAELERFALLVDPAVAGGALN
jgi:hypothetical protein